MYKVKEFLSFECKQENVRIKELVAIKCQPVKLDLDDPLNMEVNVQKGEYKLKEDTKVEHKTKKVKNL